MLFPFGVVAFLGCVVLSRILNERALQTLDDSQKVRLLDTFSANRAWSLLPVILVVVVIFAVPRLVPAAERWIFGGSVVLLLTYVFVLHYWVKAKLAAVELPETFMRKFLAARHISHAGMIIMFAVLLFEL